eukprot:409825_1
MKVQLATVAVILSAIALVNRDLKPPIQSQTVSVATTTPDTTHIAQQSQNAQPNDLLAFGHGSCLHQTYYLSMNGSGRVVSRCPVGGSPRLSPTAVVRQRTYLLA